MIQVDNFYAGLFAGEEAPLFKRLAENKELIDWRRAVDALFHFAVLDRRPTPAARAVILASLHEQEGELPRSGAVEQALAEGLVGVLGLDPDAVEMTAASGSEEDWGGEPCLCGIVGRSAKFRSVGEVQRRDFMRQTAHRLANAFANCEDERAAGYFLAMSDVRTFGEAGAQMRVIDRFLEQVRNRLSVAQALDGSGYIGWCLMLAERARSSR